MTRRLQIAVTVSVLLHLAILGSSIVVLPRLAPVGAKPDQEARVELLMLEQKGAGQTSAGDPSPPASQPSLPPQADASQTKPEPAQEDALPAQAEPPSRQPALAPAQAPDPELPAAAPTPPKVAMARPQAEPSTPSPPPAATTKQPPMEPAPEAAPLQFNLGGTESLSSAIASGDNVIPASIDNRARNRPPVYPEEAARRGQQGAVLLLIHVSASGRATGSDVLQTSGVPALDQAAQQAVASWRFLPAMKAGQAIPFDMPMRFVFEYN